MFPRVADTPNTPDSILGESVPERVRGQNYISRSDAVKDLRRGKRYVVGPRIVIGERESQHDRQPKDRANDHQLGAPGAVACVHEVENNERGLDRGNAKGDDNVELMKVLKRGPNGKACAKHQGRENDDINFWRNNVLGHARPSYRCLSIRYNNGNR